MYSPVVNNKRFNYTLALGLRNVGKIPTSSNKIGESTLVLLFFPLFLERHCPL